MELRRRLLTILAIGVLAVGSVVDRGERLMRWKPEQKGKREVVDY